MLWRALTIASVVLFNLVRFGVRSISISDIEDSETRRSQRAALAGRILREAMQQLGATFLKLGQVLSTRPDLLPPETAGELRRLQDRVPAFEGARKIVEGELGRSISELFLEWDEHPVAAASVAQVHRARLANGQEVAVKVLRPGVQERVRADGSVILVLARMLEAISSAARHAQIVDHAGEALRAIALQTDLRVEAANSERFRKNFEDVPRVRFPKVSPEWSSARVLTMEFVRGRKIDAIPKNTIDPQLSERLRDVFLKMSFEDGFLHADLHPGNFLVGEDGTLFILDVGLATHLDDAMLDYYIDFNRVLVMGDVSDVMGHIRKYHSYVEGTVDWNELERDVVRLDAEWRTLSARQLEFGKLIDELFAVARKHGVRPVPEMTMMMVGLVTAEGIGKQLDPDANSFGAVANYLLPLLARKNMLTPELMQRAAAVAARLSR